MLSKPVYGWSSFQLEGTSIYKLSYLDDIPLDWLEQAIHGLETLLPFCVKADLEPEFFLCVVSYYNCHIICEEGGYPLEKEEIKNEISNTNMLRFCEYLYDDISKNIDDWAAFYAFDNHDDELIVNKKKEIIKKLAHLRELIQKKAKFFDEKHVFI